MLISGPVNLDVLYSKTDKHYVYIFGDVHEDLKYLCKKKNKAPVIWDFLFKLIISNPITHFNILIETYQVDDDVDYKFNNIDSIYKIIDKFKCFSKEKNKNQFQNAMIHYIDYRIMTSYGYLTNKFNKNYKESYKFFHNIELIDCDLLHFLLLFYNNKNTHNYVTDLYKYTTLIYNILKKQFEVNNINTISDYINDFKAHIDYSKIEKQYTNIEANLYIDVLRAYTNGYFNIILNKYKNINFKEIVLIFNNVLCDWEKNKKTFDFFKESHINKIYTFYTFNFEMQLVLMDLYAMGRLLRHYKEYDDIKYKDKAKYSVLYVGNKHGVLYTKLLKQMNFNLLYTSKTYDNKKRCICIDDAAFNDLNL